MPRETAVRRDLNGGQPANRRRVPINCRRLITDRRFDCRWSSFVRRGGGMRYCTGHSPAAVMWDQLPTYHRPATDCWDLQGLRCREIAQPGSVNRQPAATGVGCPSSAVGCPSTDVRFTAPQLRLTVGCHRLQQRLSSVERRRRSHPRNPWDCSGTHNGAELVAIGTASSPESTARLTPRALAGHTARRHPTAPHRAMPHTLYTPGQSGRGHI